jgi:histidyl-tRNA synthetase
VCEDGADRAAVMAAMSELRRRGARVDMDYAGRSAKGQRTQAGRLGARHVVVVDGATDLRNELAGLEL